MMVKLLMSWDIKPDRETDYFEFVVREFVPGITKLGLQPADAWLTLYGDCSQVHTSGIAENLQTMRRILETPEWDALHERLLEYVDNYDQRIIRAEAGLQL